MVANVAEMTPTRAVTQAASIRPRFANIETYHLMEKPPHTVTSLEALNENTIRMTIGRYRKAKPSTTELMLKRLHLPIMA